MALPNVSAGDAHVGSHNAERALINNIQGVTDPDFLVKLTAFIATTRTTVQLVAATDSINNADNKFRGRMVYNTTTKKPVWADGTASTSVWVDATGATAHTPA